MEIYRRHGLSGRLRAQGLSKGSKTDAAYFTRLRGHELHRVDLPTPEEALAETREPGTRWPTPEPQFRSSQLTLEPLLLERARSFPTTEVRFGSRVTGLEARSDGVSLQVEGDGATSRLDADYVVGCDGGRSFVRRAMGVRYAGEGGLEMDFMGGRMLATYFRAPGLRALMRHPHAWQNWIILPHLRALMLTLDAEEGLYLLHFQLPPEGRPAPTAGDPDAVLRVVTGRAVPTPAPAAVPIDPPVPPRSRRPDRLLLTLFARERLRHVGALRVLDGRAEGGAGGRVPGGCDRPRPPPRGAAGREGLPRRLHDIFERLGRARSQALELRSAAATP